MNDVVCIKKPVGEVKNEEIVKPDKIINSNITTQQMLNELGNTMGELNNSLYRAYNLIPPNKNINNNITTQQMLNELGNTMEELVNSIYRAYNMEPPK